MWGSQDTLAFLSYTLTLNLEIPYEPQDTTVYPQYHPFHSNQRGTVMPRRLLVNTEQVRRTCREWIALCHVLSRCAHTVLILKYAAKESMMTPHSIPDGYL